MHVLRRLIAGTPKAPVLLAGLVVIIHLICIAYLMMAWGRAGTSVSLSVQALVAIVVSLLISCAFGEAHARPLSLVFALLFAQRCMSLAVRDALPHALLLESSILVCVMLETAYFVPIRYGVFAAAILFALPAIFDLPVVPETGSSEPAGGNSWFLLAACAGSIFASGLMLRRSVDRANRLQQQVDTQMKDMIQLSAANEKFQEHAQRIGEESTLNERNRITRDLHDSIGYTLTTAGVMLDTCLGLLRRRDPGAEEAIERAKTVIQGGYQEVRGALHALRSIEEGRTTGLPAIARLVQTFRDVTGMTVDVHYTNVPSHLGREVDLALYHVVQEALVNAFRHGNASNVLIILSRNLDNLQFLVRDNGIGSSEITKGIGLNGSSERLERLGGTFSYASDAIGFKIQGEIPLHPRGGAA